MVEPLSPRARAMGTMDTTVVSVVMRDVYKRQGSGSNGTGLDMEQECRNRKKEKVEDSNYNRSNLISNLKALR